MITGGVCSAYGLSTWGDLFTERQTLILAVFSKLVENARSKIYEDAIRCAAVSRDGLVTAGERQAEEYAKAVCVYLGLVTSKLADYGSSLVVWSPTRDQLKTTFSRQALPMSWDFAETNPFAGAAGDISTTLEGAVRALQSAVVTMRGTASQEDATASNVCNQLFHSTDPPYYDNVGYAALSDFFYVWLRQSLRTVATPLLRSDSTPKERELIANVSRHGTKAKAEQFFLGGMTKALEYLVRQTHPAAPVTVYYAFKQSETKGDQGTSSTGWETFLSAVLSAGFVLTGTWPMRTERAERSLSLGSNALASSIILVCRPRAKDAPSVSRRQFQRELNAVLPEALDEMTRGGGSERSPVAPVDLSQAIIGPGMAIFSKYAAVLEADGTPMSVRTALQLINRFLAEDDFDADTQFCLAWFAQHGWDKGQFGEADVLARAKGTAVDAVKQSGIIEAGGGSVRLLKWAEYTTDANAAERRVSVWGALHRLIQAHRTEGDAGAGRVLSAVAGKAEAARQLAYRLYTLCERAGRAEDARAYNEVVTGWGGIESEAVKVPDPKQQMMFE